jgi:hypothetical protein
MVVADMHSSFHILIAFRKKSNRNGSTTATAFGFSFTFTRAVTRSHFALSEIENMDVYEKLVSAIQIKSMVVVLSENLLNLLWSCSPLRTSILFCSGKQGIGVSKFLVLTVK